MDCHVASDKQTGFGPISIADKTNHFMWLIQSARTGPVTVTSHKVKVTHYIYVRLRVYSAGDIKLVAICT